MIVEPDFPTHWKTRALIRLLDYEAAPMCVIALWSHCQQRKTDRFFGLTYDAFASICGYPFPTQAHEFYKAMLTVGFIEQADGGIVVHDFAKANAQLFANWENGKRGGRPSRTSDEPTANPSETHRKPNPEMGKPIDKIRLDKSREEKIDKTDKKPSRAALVFPAGAGEDFEKAFHRWAEVRRGLGKKPKDWNVMFQEQIDWLWKQPAGHRLEILSQSIRNGWQGLFKLNGSAPPKSSPTDLSQQQLDDIPVSE